MDFPFVVVPREGCAVVRLQSSDGTNRLTLACVLALSERARQLAAESRPQPLVIAGNRKFFSAGADLREISALGGPAALEFSKVGFEAA